MPPLTRIASPQAAQEAALRRLAALRQQAAQGMGRPVPLPVRGVDEAIAMRGRNKPLPVNMATPQTATVAAPSIGFGLGTNGEFNPFTGTGGDTAAERTAVVKPSVTHIPKAINEFSSDPRGFTPGISGPVTTQSTAIPTPVTSTSATPRTRHRTTPIASNLDFSAADPRVGNQPDFPEAPAAPTATDAPGVITQNTAGTNQSVTNGLTPEEFLRRNAPRVHRVGVAGQDIDRGQQLSPFAGVIHPSAQAWKNFTDIERKTFQSAVESTGLPWETFLDEARLKNVMGTTPGLRGPYSMVQRPWMAR